MLHGVSSILHSCRIMLYIAWSSLWYISAGPLSPSRIKNIDEGLRNCPPQLTHFVSWQKFCDCVFYSAFQLTVDIIPEVTSKFSALVFVCDTPIVGKGHIMEQDASNKAKVAPSGFSVFPFLANSIFTSIIQLLHSQAAWIIVLILHPIVSESQWPLTTHANLLI